MALAGVIGPICRDAAGLLVRRYPAEQVRQHRCIANGAACHFDSAYFQCVLIKTYVGLAPEAAFAAAVLACVPFSPSPSALMPVLYARAVHRQVQRTF